MPNPEDIQDNVRYGLLFSPKPIKVTEDQIAYFSENPDEIEEYSSPINIHSYFLFFAGLAGAALVAVSKFLKYSSWLPATNEALDEFIVDIIFEVGVAMIGAVATAYFLGVLLNRQQRNAAAWRTEIREIIDRRSEGS